jgi:threonine synthase
VRESGGSVVAVEEAEIVQALRDLARLGLYVEPTAAAAAAGLTRLLASGVIRPREDTVLVLTGSGLKASATIGELLKLAAR